MNNNCINKSHLRHPWQLSSSTDSRLHFKSLTTQQKLVSLAALVLKFPLVLVCGIVAFLTRRIKQLLGTLPPDAQKAQEQSRIHLPPAPDKPAPAPVNPPPTLHASEHLPPAPDKPTPAPVNPPPTLHASEHVGMTKGFQGNNNSCGICAVLYTLFATTTAFDHLLIAKKGDPVQQSLRTIVEDFRNRGYVSSEKIEALRQLVCPEKGDEHGKVDLDEFYNQLLSKLGIDLTAHLLDPTPFSQKGMEERARERLGDAAYNRLTELQRLDLFKAVQQPSITTQALAEGATPPSQVGQALMLYIPRQAGLRPYKQVIAQPEITVPSDEGPVKMRLASLISMGDYDPANRGKPSEGHFVSFSLDPKGTGYAFDSMADREGDQNIPEVRRLDQFLPKLQQLQPDDKIGQHADARRVLFNLRACLYVRA
jgi:hypothetical protein